MSFIYNPGLQDVEALLRGFVAREDLLVEVTADLGAPRPSHRLFVGQRGMGKTTLLRRIAAEVTRDPALAARWLALTFPEEQYNVVRLSDFWLNCLDAAADALHAQGATARVAEIDTFVASLPDAEAERCARAQARLLEVAGAGRGLVLCVDNLQQVLGRLDEQEHWALRKVLGASAGLVLLAASPFVPEDTQDYGAAFYDFLSLTRLEGLDLDATVRMLGALGDAAGRPELRVRLESRPGRVHALHTLTGGNPRTVAMLFEVLIGDPEADVRALFEGLVDRATPLYKARFEELAEQAQVVLGALALEWHPATAARLADATRLDVNTVSTQLSRLHRDGLVLKVEVEGEARTAFLVAERFFNLWYLVRASRRLRARVLGFARCLEALYEPEEIQGLAAALLARSTDPELISAVSSLVPDPATKRALWSRLPAGELGEYVAEPEVVAWGDGVEANKRRFAGLCAEVGGLALEAPGLTREGAEVAAGIARTTRSDFFDLLARVLGHESRRRLTRGLAEAYRSGLLAPGARFDEVDADAAAMASGYSGLTCFLRVVGGGPVDLAALGAAGDVGLTVIVSMWAAAHHPDDAVSACQLLEPALRPAFSPELAKLLLDFNHHPAAARLADVLREDNLPIAVAIDVALAKDLGLLTRYAPEVRDAARTALDKVWPAHRDVAASTPPPRGRRSRRR